MKKSAYLIISYLILIPTALIIGLQFGMIERQYERARDAFAEGVAKAVSSSGEVYARWTSHVSFMGDSSSFDWLYTSPDSAFVLMLAQSVQTYPLLDFQPDSLLPQLRKEQLIRFKDELEQTRNRKNKQIKEFYIFRAIQYCMGCETNIQSIAQIFPLDSLIRHHLTLRDIHTEVQIAFYNKKDQRYGYLSPGADSIALAHSTFQFTFNEQEQLRLYFPGYEKALWRSLLLPVIASAVLTIICLLCYGMASHMLNRQKELSEMKNDFINNVTHEFKTPIATISFAIANIENEKIITQPEAIRQFTKVLKEENQRLNAQVEKVLQAAIIEKKALDLKKEPTDLHALAHRLADAYDLKLPDNHKIQRNLQANHTLLEGDPFHLSNAISNLLDNAIKYSGQYPEIAIFTYNKPNKIVLEVSDKGVGISKENQRLVFDKFYRVSTGNLHQVKGFGLGLSYVKEIVERHQGKISLRSQEGKGSTFCIELPLVQKSEKP